MSNSDFLKKVSAFIAKHQMLQKEGTYLVALSGGADSVALLCAMQALGYRVKAAHCNFHLRGEESLRDAQFCKQLCKERGIFMHQTNFDTRAHAAKRKISIEMAARQLRYTYFYKMFWKYGYAGVCIAHHRDDSVETLLINLIRGTGIHGLRGITPVNEIFYRPLLGVSRMEIEDYLSSIGQDYITDSSNLVDDVVRNKIRLNVLPLLETINPSVRKSIAKTADRMRDAAAIIDRVMETIVATPQHRYQILTKRPERLHEYFTTHDVPLNVWLGTTVESRRNKFRIDYLRGLHAPVRFLSCEPLIEDLGEMDLTGINWVIVGGESGMQARPIKEDWIIRIKDQCEQHHIAFFFKQWGTWGQDGIKRNKHANGKLLQGEIIQKMPTEWS